MPTSLESIPELNAHLPKLAKLGIRSLEEAIGVAQAAPKQLSDYLGIDAQKTLDPYLRTVDPAQIAEMTRVLSLPCPVDPIQSVASLDSVPDYLEPAPYPSSVNHVAEMPPIRGQGGRNTCVAFAGLSCYEHFLGTTGNPIQLSEQFLYCESKLTDGHPTAPGTRLVIAYLALKNYGCSPLVDWPYIPTQDPNNESQGPPPDGTVEDAANYRLQSPMQLPPRSLQDFRNYLYAGRCVAFALPVFPSSLNNGPARLYGYFQNPLQTEMPSGSHALCIVGYLDQPDHPELGGGTFLVRNSWWPAWGVQSPIAPGYGTISYLYVSRFATEAVAVAVG